MDMRREGVKDSRISFILMMFILTWFSLDAVRNMVSFIVVSGVYLLWIGLVILKNPDFIGTIVQKSYFILIWVMLVMLRSILGRGALTNELIYAISFLMIYIIFLYYSKTSIETRRAIVLTVLVAYAISGLITLYYLNLDSDVVRMAGAGLLDSDHYLSKLGSGVLMIGGWDYVYSLVGTVLVLLLCYRMKGHRTYQVAIGGLILLFGVIVLKASLSTAVLLLAVFLAWVFAPAKRSRKVLYILSILAIGLSILPLAEYILVYLLKNIDNDNYIYKLQHAISFIRGEMGLIAFYNRFGLMLISLKTIFQHFFFGVYGVMANERNMISGHSQWLDDFAKFGVINQVVFFAGLVKVRSSIMEMAENSEVKRIIQVVFAYFLILGFLNPVLLLHIYLLFFIIAPFSFTLKKGNVRRINMEQDMSLGELFGVLKQNFGKVVGWGVVGLALASLYTSFIAIPLYQSDLQIVVNQKESAQAQITNNDIQTNLNLINTYQSIIKAPIILEEVVVTAGGGLTIDELRDKITVNIENNSLVFGLTVSDEDPYRAADLANAVAQTFEDKIGDILDVKSVTILSRAVPRLNPVSPNRTLNFAIGTLLGTVIGTIIAYLSAYLDKRVKHQKIIDDLNWTNLGTVLEMSSQEIKSSRRSNKTIIPMGNQPAVEKSVWRRSNV